MNLLDATDATATLSLSAWEVLLRHGWSSHDHYQAFLNARAARGRTEDGWPSQEEITALRVALETVAGQTGAIVTEGA